MPRILMMVGLTQEPTTMVRTADSEQPTNSVSGPSAETADALSHKLLPFGWLLFTSVWLLFPVGFVIQVLRTSDLSLLRLLALLTVLDRKSTRLNSSHANISYAVFCLKKKIQRRPLHGPEIRRAQV